MAAEAASRCGSGNAFAGGPAGAGVRCGGWGDVLMATSQRTDDLGRGQTRSSAVPAVPKLPRPVDGEPVTPRQLCWLVRTAQFRGSDACFGDEGRKVWGEEGREAFWWAIPSRGVTRADVARMEIAAEWWAAAAEHARAMVDTPTE